MKRKNNYLMIIIILLLLIFAGSLCIRASKKGTVSISVPEGANSVEISQILKDNGLISNKTYFLARLYLSPYRGKLRYGTFKLDKNAFVGSIFKTLSKDGAKRDTVSITIPEGYSVEMIEDKLVETGLCTKAEFEAALKYDYDYDFLDCVPDSKEIKYRLQGFLYPDTYEFYTDASAQTVIDTMLKEFQKKTEALSIPEKDLLGIITKASLIEREAKLESERTIIAGVIENRIKDNMRLQIDASVMYVISEGRYNIKTLRYKDLKILSKYNTYRFIGLPIGPICSPSLSSIEAAISPAEHKYLFYHTDTEKNDGSHIFTETYTEHTSTIK